MSEEKKKKKIGIRQHLERLLDDLHEGVRPTDYGRGAAEEIPHSTVHDLLQILKATNTAYLDEEDGKWHYTWYKDKKEIRAQHQTFASWDEYRAKLDHSKTLIEEIVGRKIEDIRDDFVFTEEFTYNRVWPRFLRHLVEQYPKTYKKYRDWQEQVDILHTIEGAFQNAIKRIFLTHGFTVRLVLKKGEGVIEISSDSGSVSPIFIDFIKELLHIGAGDKFKDEIKLELSEARLDDPLHHKLITTNVVLQSDLEAVIQSCINDAELKTLYSEIERVRTEVRVLESGLNGDIAEIIDQIKLGSPLKGSCDACKYTIGR